MVIANQLITSSLKLNKILHYRSCILIYPPDRVYKLSRSGSFELKFDVIANSTGYIKGYISSFLSKSKNAETLGR
ncbi:hypothetical protein, partial [Marivivens sp.]|uniref:hypothetical protein n=1 Tax=Marivivens sp. TaxID=1978374 RepID=UPI0025C00D67